MTMQQFEDEPQLFPELLCVKSSQREIEQSQGITGFGNFRAIGVGEDVQYDTISQAYAKTFRHVRYGLGFKVDKTLVEDDKWGLMARMAKELGRSAHHSQEIQAAAIFNNGFSSSDPAYLGPDGKVLFASDHPMPGRGAAQSNVMTAAQLGTTSLQAALVALTLQRDYSNKLVRIKADKLLVHPALQYLALELTKSDKDPHSGNNAINALKYGRAGLPTPYTWPFLTSTTAWFILPQAKDCGVIWWNRTKRYTTGTVDHDSEAAKTAMRYRVSVGIESWQGMVGNAGA